jgi:hypothetical protein
MQTFFIGNKSHKQSIIQLLSLEASLLRNFFLSPLEGEAFKWPDEAPGLPG